jgi:hypothetical protein
MSNRSRSLAIGLMGPAIAGLGLAWMLLDALFDSTPESATLRYFLFDSAHLVIATGILVSAVGVPLALVVSESSSEDVEIPVFGPDEALTAEPGAAPEGRLATER